jgi:choline dehydrogenase-like flavoprotein
MHPEDRSATSHGALALREIFLAARQRRYHGGMLRELQHLLRDSDHRRALLDLLQPRSLIKDSPSVAVSVARKLSRRYRANPEVLHLSFSVEQTPNPESRVTLSEKKRDLFGQQRPVLDWKVSDQDLHTVMKAQQVLDRVLRESGLGRIEGMFDVKSPPRLTGQWHHMGTTRMHADPKHGVVDADCRVHGLENLYIAGSSVFPTVGYVNPTLTLVALALRLADHVKKRL